MKEGLEEASTGPLDRTHLAVLVRLRDPVRPADPFREPILSKLSYLWEEAMPVSETPSRYLAPKCRPDKAEYPQFSILQAAMDN